MAFLEVEAIAPIRDGQILYCRVYNAASERSAAAAFWSALASGDFAEYDAGEVSLDWTSRRIGYGRFAHTFTVVGRVTSWASLKNAKNQRTTR